MHLCNERNWFMNNDNTAGTVVPCPAAFIIIISHPEYFASDNKSYRRIHTKNDTTKTRQRNKQNRITKVRNGFLA